MFGGVGEELGWGDMIIRAKRWKWIKRFWIEEIWMTERSKIYKCVVIGKRCGARESSSGRDGETVKREENWNNNSILTSI